MPRIGSRYPAFQSAPPHGGRRGEQQVLAGGMMFQSAPPHGGRLGRNRGCHRVEVSIRAPARGATQIQFASINIVKFQSAPPHGGRQAGGAVFHPVVLFQSAPPHGGRPPGPPRVSSPPSFNPRPRTGGDAKARLFLARQVVSIRAPARGATRRLGRRGRKSRFQSAPPHGGRRSIDKVFTGDFTFQSAPPHGGRHLYIHCASGPAVFQSAPPHGGRLEI